MRVAGEEDLLTDSWIKVADEDAVPDGGMLPVYPRGLGLGCPLESGVRDVFVITCPCHDWRFDVRTGGLVEAPEIAIATYPVRVAGGEVFVEL